MIVSITEEQFFDYCRCPVFYNIKYENNKLKVSFQHKSQNKLLQQVVGAFCMQLRDGKILGPVKLKKLWDRICEDEHVSAQNIKSGISKILAFYRWAENEELRIVDCFTRYCCNFKLGKEKHLHLEGTFGIFAAKDGTSEIEEILIDFSNTLPDQARLDADMRTSISHVAFYYNYKKPLLGTKIFHPKSGKEYYTIRDPLTESKRVAKAVYNVAKAIEEKIWYPHESALCANSCDVKDFCKMYGINI